jgi:hypothetical protein
MFGEEWTARMIAAVLIGLTVLGVSVFGVMQGLDSIREGRANADARRIASTLEAMDHKPGAVARLNFVQDYAIEVVEGAFTIQSGSIAPRRHKINLNDDVVMTGSMDAVSYVCIRNTGSRVELSSDCSLPDN